jgi:hypothetical protein
MTSTPTQSPSQYKKRNTSPRTDNVLRNVCYNVSTCKKKNGSCHFEHPNACFYCLNDMCSPFTGKHSLIKQRPLSVPDPSGQGKRNVYKIHDASGKQIIFEYKRPKDQKQAEQEPVQLLPADETIIIADGTDSEGDSSDTGETNDNSETSTPGTRPDEPATTVQTSRRLTPFKLEIPCVEILIRDIKMLINSYRDDCIKAACEGKFDTSAETINKMDYLKEQLEALSVDTAKKNHLLKLIVENHHKTTTLMSSLTAE